MHGKSLYFVKCNLRTGTYQFICFTFQSFCSKKMCIWFNFPTRQPREKPSTICYLEWITTFDWLTITQRWWKSNLKPTSLGKQNMRYSSVDISAHRISASHSALSSAIVLCFLGSDGWLSWRTRFLGSSLLSKLGLLFPWLLDCCFFSL